MASVSADQPSAVGHARCANMGCGNTGTMKCGNCKQTRYCSRECQKQDWKACHKARCGKDSGVAMGGVEALLGAVGAGASGSWYTGLKRKRVYERLWMSFQLRADDEYVFAGQMRGAYAVACGGEKADTRRDFRRFIALAKEKGVMPPDWSDADDTALMKGAEDNIHFALEKKDVVEQFGYSSMEHMVLRSMAEKILGEFGSWV